MCLTKVHCSKLSIHESNILDCCIFYMGNARNRKGRSKNQKSYKLKLMLPLKEQSGSEDGESKKGRG